MLDAAGWRGGSAAASDPVTAPGCAGPLRRARHPPAASSSSSSSSVGAAAVAATTSAGSAAAARLPEGRDLALRLL